MPHQVNINLDDCNRVSGEPGLMGMISGLRTMKAWAEENAPGWRYVAGRQVFQFPTLDDSDRFKAAFDLA